jgi:hypothetical protein
MQEIKRAIIALQKADKEASPPRPTGSPLRMSKCTPGNLRRR